MVDIFKIMDKNNDFVSILNSKRYLSRVKDFNQMIAASDNHYWDPEDVRYIDYSIPFDYKKELIFRDKVIIEQDLPCVLELDDVSRVGLLNDLSHLLISRILHGEQAALTVSATLCDLFENTATQEFVANQVREEARHVNAFTKYINVRWGHVLPCEPYWSEILSDVVNTRSATKKVVGMQIIIEGLAMMVFGTAYQNTNDLLLKRLLLLVLSDEAFHHKFGKMWGKEFKPSSEDELIEISAWSRSLIEKFFLGNRPLRGKADIYKKYGIDFKLLFSQLKSKVFQISFIDSLEAKTIVHLVRLLYQSNLISEKDMSFYKKIVPNWSIITQSESPDEMSALGEEFIKVVSEANSSLDRKNKHLDVK